MEILIIGSKGILGSELLRFAEKSGYTVIGTDKEDLDISNKELVANFFKKSNPEIIINCSVISPKECELYPDLAFAVNVQGVENLLSNKGKAKLIQFSSPAVFDNLPPLKNIQYGYDMEYGWKETDSVNAKSIYGKTKIESERIIIGTDNLILRTSWIYTKDRPFGLADTIQFPINEIGRPTYSKDIWKFILICLKENLKGTYHICGPEIMSRFEQAKRLEIIPKISHLEQDNIRPISISKIQPLLNKHKIKLTKWGKAFK